MRCNRRAHHLGCDKGDVQIVKALILESRGTENLGLYVEILTELGVHHQSLAVTRLSLVE